jgi:hypothetical protein
LIYGSRETRQLEADGSQAWSGGRFEMHLDLTT